MGTVTHRCTWCATTNRIPATVGDRRVLCGRCRGPLPTPRILELLVDIHRELEAIAIDSAKAVWTADALRPRLERQKLRMAHAQKFYRGFEATVSSSIELVVSMQVIVQEIEIKLQRRGLLEATLKAVLTVLLRILRVQISVPLQLPPA
ncbi:hypothetical protein [Agromyces larvae]|uniref:Uncharacterized protein n=1 Tax=Agromyces larvae TaxID=2929802 RepID=A0ABY4C562_9MICO|nr:hypothetical protein [Agromyces larvae]UOE45133.1 hypothetical protein MTO99_04960 [Agromyces larvae]